MGFQETGRKHTPLFGNPGRRENEQKRNQEEHCWKKSKNPAESKSESPLQGHGIPHAVPGKEAASGPVQRGGRSAL